MFEKLESCPSCGHPKFNNHLIASDHAHTGESFALVQCDKCELVFTNPRPTQHTIAPYYGSEDYISHTNKTSGLVGIAYRIVRNITLRQKEKLISKHSPTQGSLLDFGCGTGFFLQYCMRKGWSTEGMEPDPKAAVAATKNAGTTIHQTLDEIKGSFDVITAWHVLEHVHDLSETLRQLKSLLNENGRLVIALPNVNSWDAKHYKENWAGLDVPRHLYHFTRSSFEILTQSRKLKIIDIVPMKFDAYYVSLLSERYQQGSSVTAFMNGLNSNKAAKQTGEYSSLIYVLTK